MIAAIVLAAGAGTRLGRPKALAQLAGRPLIERVVLTCSASAVDEIVVVTGADAAELEAAVTALSTPTGSPPVRCARNDGWQRGRTGSLQLGWSTVPQAHVLVFPVDHPTVEVVTLDVLLGVFGYAAASPEVVVPVVQAAGQRKRGHPILLASSLRDELLSLGSDEPLRDLVHRHGILEVPVDDEGILLDVDTPQDLLRAEDLLAAREIRAQS